MPRKAYLKCLYCLFTHVAETPTLFFIPVVRCPEPGPKQATSGLPEKQFVFDGRFQFFYFLYQLET